MPSRSAFFAICLATAFLLSAALPARPAPASEQTPAFTVALVGTATSKAGLDESRDALRELASEDMQQRLGLSWRCRTSEHLAQSVDGMAEAVSRALAEKPSLVVCADIPSLQAALAARTDATPLFVPLGVPLDRRIQGFLVKLAPQNVFVHNSIHEGAPKLAKAIQYLGAKRVGMLCLAPPGEEALQRFATHQIKTAESLGCELVSVSIDDETPEACQKGMAKLAELAPDFVFLWHLECYDTEGLGEILAPLFEERIPAVGADSASEALGGALLAFYQKLGALQSRNAYHMLRILFAESSPLPPLSMTSEVAVNMGTASTLGIHLPIEVLVEADYIFWETRNWPSR